MSDIDHPSRVLGCLLGGAVGDALGAPVEFDSLAEIRSRFGAGGVTDYVEAYGRRGAITDDTQMTLFTAEGLIRAFNRYSSRGIASVPAAIDRAYRRWGVTQGLPWVREEHFNQDPDGWLIGVPELHSRRAPGNTCLGALATHRHGTPQEPINGSKGCGGVMRVAPIAFTGAGAFELGCQAAALTHGHPSGYLSAGFLSLMLQELFGGRGLPDAIQSAIGELKRWPDHQEVERAVRRAIDRAGAGVRAEDLEELGKGWVAEEALAIGLAAVLSGRDFRESVLLAVNHSGDSDSTGSIAGQIRGVMDGVEAIPESWLARLELRREIETIAEDLHRCFVEGVPDAPDNPDGTYDWDRYPGW
jgi:ADP-ribosylglycohydrolase